MDFNSYIGLPFKERGRTREGVDCWGLCYLFYPEQMGITIPSYDQVYVNTEDPEISRTIRQEEGLDFVKVDEEQPGDIVLIRMRGQPWHVGIIVSKGLMLHVEQGVQNSVIEKYRSLKWEKRILGFYRHKSLL